VETANTHLGNIGSKPIICRFWHFGSIAFVFYTASASKYFLQKQNILFLTKIILP